MPNLAKALLALWLLLSGVAQGKSMHTAGPPPGNFFAQPAEAIRENPPQARIRITIIVWSAWKCASDCTYCHNDPINRVDVLGAAEAPVHAGNLALAEQMLEDGQSALAYWSSIETVLPSAMPMGMMAPDGSGGHRPMAAKEYEALRMITSLRDTGKIVLPPDIARSHVATGELLAWKSKHHLRRFYRQAAFQEEAGGFAPGSIDPLQAGALFDETNPEFQESESRAFWLSLNPARTTALHFHHGRIAKGFLSYAGDVALWSAFSIGGEFISTGRVGFSSGFTFAAKTPLTPNPYAGVQEASAYLRAQDVPRHVRKQVLESFDVRTIQVRQAGGSEFGLRYFDGVNAQAKGRYLFETFPASRASLALDPKWNGMTNFTQWQVRPGATLFEGVASPQGVGLPGGQIQKFVPSLDDLLSP